MHIKHNIEALSRNHCCRGKISITYSECVSVALIKYINLWSNNAKRMRRNAWSVWLCHIFTRNRINGTILGKKKVVEYKMCVLIISTTFF